MRKLINDLSYFCEQTSSRKSKTFTGMIGAFGGKDHWWPKDVVSSVGYKNWELYWIGDLDIFGDAWEISLRYDGDLNATVNFDAESWLKSAGKKPIKYKIEAYGDKKEGTVRSPSDVTGVLDGAEKYAIKMKESIRKKAPVRKGWDASGDYELVYVYEPTMKHGASLNVRVEDDFDSLSYSGGSGVATIELETDYDSVSKQIKIKKISDIAKVLKTAEDIWDGSRYGKSRNRERG